MPYPLLHLCERFGEPVGDSVGVGRKSLVMLALVMLASCLCRLGSSTASSAEDRMIHIATTKLPR